MAVVLNKFEDMNYAEIAEVMGLTTKAVKSLLSRARGRLRDALIPYMARGQRVPAPPRRRGRRPGLTMPTPRTTAPTTRRLVAYLDGELDPAAQQRVEARLSLDPMVRAEAEALQTGMGHARLPAAAGAVGRLHRTRRWTASRRCGRVTPVEPVRPPGLVLAGRASGMPPGRPRSSFAAAVGYSARPRPGRWYRPTCGADPLTARTAGDRTPAAVPRGRTTSTICSPSTVRTCSRRAGPLEGGITGPPHEPLALDAGDGRAIAAPGRAPPATRPARRANDPDRRGRLQPVPRRCSAACRPRPEPGSRQLDKALHEDEDAGTRIRLFGGHGAVRRLARPPAGRRPGPKIASRPRRARAAAGRPRHPRPPVDRGPAAGLPERLAKAAPADRTPTPGPMAARTTATACQERQLGPPAVRGRGVPFARQRQFRDDVQKFVKDILEQAIHGTARRQRLANVTSKGHRLELLPSGLHVQSKSTASARRGPAEVWEQYRDPKPRCGKQPESGRGSTTEARRTRRRSRGVRHSSLLLTCLAAP